MEMALSQPIQKGQQVLSTSSWARKHERECITSDEFCKMEIRHILFKEIATSFK
jgi:hypothetical protein